MRVLLAISESGKYFELIIRAIIIHSKYFPDSEPVTDDQIWKSFVFNEEMTSKMQRFCRLMHR